VTTASLPNTEPRSARAAHALARLALGLAGIGALAALLAGPAYRLRWLPLSDAFMALRWATCAAIAAALAGLVAFVVLVAVRAPRGRAMAAFASGLGMLVAAPPLYTYDQAQRLPKIHDITTDTNDPPAFVDVLPLRQSARNPVAYAAETAIQQRRGYPDIAPLRLDLAPGQAYARAEHAARAMGWRIVAARPEALRIEATDTTLFFGFEDDIVVRVRPQVQGPVPGPSPGSVVDVRSLSRIGGSDIGANARRVRAYLHKLAAD
jgi:uncharacterized protein (DUF1499 family)